MSKKTNSTISVSNSKVSGKIMNKDFTLKNAPKPPKK
jgi:hypothetical protein